MPAAKLTVAFCALALLTGCTDYYDHQESMVPYAGEAIAANRVAQMVDPWPAASASPKIRHHGERMLKAMDNYKNNATASSTTSSTSDSSGNGEQSDNGSSETGSSSVQQ